jgi:hypothetical protein
MKTIKQESRLKSKETKKHSGAIALILSYFSSLVNQVADMEKQGISEKVVQGEIGSKTRDGKDVNIKYGYGIKLGLENLRFKISDLRLNKSKIDNRKS